MLCPVWYVLGQVWVMYTEVVVSHIGRVLVVVIHGDFSVGIMSSSS